MSTQQVNRLKREIDEYKRLRRAYEATERQRDELMTALNLMLDSVDYQSGACSVNEMVGAALPVKVLEIARKAKGGR